MKTCIIAANGPSFKRIPPGTLDSTPTFGVNFCGFQPMYYVCVDSRVLVEHSHEIYDLAKNAEIAYLSAKHAPSARPGAGKMHLYNLPNVELVWKDHGAFGAEQYMSGMTATYVALKMCYYAGFDNVFLWGVDHSTGWEHYKPEYPSDVAATRRERMRIMLWHYTLAMNVFARAGRRILNFSDPSDLDRIFRRGTEEDIIKAAAHGNQSMLSVQDRKAT